MSPGIAWGDVSAEATRHLQQAIRFDTTNPPGNELPLAAYLADVLRADGIESTIIEQAPNRGLLHARLAGNGTGRPILLTAHMDVVGVERDQWTTDPFGGEIRDGFVYGRGAIDDKGMLAAILVAFLLLKRTVLDRGGTLSRDVVFLVTSDEEAGGELGMTWILEHHPQLLDAEFAINEGGRIRMLGGRPAYAAIQTAEKVSTILRLRARGPGGHAAIPLEGNAVVRLARALEAITRTKLPVDLSDTTREFFGRLSAIWPVEAERAAMAALGSGEVANLGGAEDVLARTPKLDALLRDTLSPTMLGAGVRHNVIPTEAEATLSLRTLPGHSPEQIVEELRGIIGDAHVELTIESHGCAAPVSRHDSPMFIALSEAIRELDESIVTVPYLSTGATESAFLRRYGIECYGLLPFPLSDEDEARMHDHDERISIDALGFGVRLLYSAVRRLTVGP